MRLSSLTLVALLFAGCKESTESTDAPISIVPSQPFRIDFGRGSGWHGLDTVAITSDGHVTLYRLSEERHEQVLHQFCETTTLQLQQASISDLLAAVEETGVLTLDRAYHGDVADGAQWVFRVQQGSNEKSIYCDNNFPEPIRHFADSLDAILAKNGLSNARWQRVPDAGARDHEKILWDSIER